MSVARPARLFADRYRLTIVVVAVVLALLATASPGPATGKVAAVDDPLRAAEASLLARVTADRQARGLVPLRLDERLADVARLRAAEVAGAGVLSHERTGGRSVFDLLTERGIRWYGAGEVLAWNSLNDPLASAAWAQEGWIGSPPHSAILRANDLNYIGLGVAADARGGHYWAGVVIRGPDRSGAVARISSVARTTLAAAAGYRQMAVAWRGSDLRLQVLTAGLRDFQVQVRYVGGAWRTTRSATTATRSTFSLKRGVRYEFRVRARDRRGNYGAWSAPVRVTP